MPPDLLGQMSSAARDDVLRDPRWEDYARGDLAEEEQEDLLARARAAGLDEETIDALGPRTPSFDERMAQTALAALAKKAPANEAATPTDARAGSGVSDARGRDRASNDARGDRTSNDPRGTDRASDDARGGASSGAHARMISTEDARTKRSPEVKAPDEAGAKRIVAEGPRGTVIPIWSRAPVIAGATFALAAAAAALLWVRRPADLPAFQMTIEGGTADVRSSDADKGGVVRLAADNRVAVTVRPDVAASRQLEARAFVYGSPKAFEWPGALAVSNTGSVRLIGRAGDLLGEAPAGRLQLCVVVGDAEALPRSPGDSPPPPKGPGFVTACRDLEWSGGK